MSSNNKEVIIITVSILALVVFGLGSGYAAGSGYGSDENDWKYKLPVGLITFILFALWFFLGIPKYQK